MWGATWNAQALFAADPWACQRKVACANALMRNRDFLLFSETHAAEGDRAAFRSARGTCSFWSVGSSRATGVGLLVPEAFLAQFSGVRWEEILPGRAARLSLVGEEGRLDLYMLYFAGGDEAAQRFDMRELLSARSRDKNAVLSVCAGDFNWIARDEHRFTKNTGCFSGRSVRREEAHWKSCVLDPLDAHEPHQPDSTHHLPVSRGRLHRVYWNSHARSPTTSRSWRRAVRGPSRPCTRP